MLAAGPAMSIYDPAAVFAQGAQRPTKEISYSWWNILAVASANAQWDLALSHKPQGPLLVTDQP